mgnify:CR=1 FL=1
MQYSLFAMWFLMLQSQQLRKRFILTPQKKHRPIITCGDIMDLFRSMMQESINRDLQHQSKGNVVSSVLAAAESLTHVCVSVCHRLWEC